jgi:S-adenosylmethionine decarboxylase
MNFKGIEMKHGSHLIVNITCSPEKLVNIEEISEVMRLACIDAGATILFDYWHPFGENCGITGVVVLAESHASIHTWNETGFAAIDVFMCGGCDPLKCLPRIEEYFQPEKLDVRLFDR